MLRSARSEGRRRLDTVVTLHELGGHWYKRTVLAIWRVFAQLNGELRRLRAEAVARVQRYPNETRPELGSAPAPGQERRAPHGSVSISSAASVEYGA